MNKIFFGETLSDSILRGLKWGKEGFEPPDTEITFSSFNKKVE